MHSTNCFKVRQNNHNILTCDDCKLSTTQNIDYKFGEIDSCCSSILKMLLRHHSIFSNTFANYFFMSIPRKWLPVSFDSRQSVNRQIFLHSSSFSKKILQICIFDTSKCTCIERPFLLHEKKSCCYCHSVFTCIPTN